MTPIWTLSAIIIVGGFIGGLAGYLIAAGTPQTSDQPATPPNLMRYLVLGLIASACVPLFLSLVQSDLISKIFETDAAKPIPFQQFLIFTGFCLIAAVSARNFIDTISSRLIQDVNRANERAAGAEQKAKEAKEQARKAEDQATAATDLVDEMAPADGREAAIAPVDDSLPANAPVPSTGSDELRVIRSLANVPFRTATGIARETKIPTNQIGEMLDSLASKGLVERTTSPHTGGLRYRITPLGVRAVKTSRQG